MLYNIFRPSEYIEGMHLRHTYLVTHHVSKTKDSSGPYNKAISGIFVTLLLEEKVRYSEVLAWVSLLCHCLFSCIVCLYRVQRNIH